MTVHKRPPTDLYSAFAKATEASRYNAVFMMIHSLTQSNILRVTSSCSAINAG